MADPEKHVKRARRSIAVAQGRHDRVVRLHRSTSLRGAEPVAGFVVSSGIRWVIVQRVGSDLSLDGYTAIRWKHLDSVHTLGPEDLISRVLGRGGVRPVEPTALDPTTTGLLLRSIPERPPLVTIWAERRSRATSWIGTIVGFENKNLHLRPISREGRLAPATFSIPFRDITRIDLRTRYSAALAAAAGLTARPSQGSGIDRPDPDRTNGDTPDVRGPSARTNGAVGVAEPVTSSINGSNNGARPVPTDLT